jgi:hypothetical protein
LFEEEVDGLLEEAEAGRRAAGTDDGRGVNGGAGDSMLLNGDDDDDDDVCAEMIV